MFLLAAAWLSCLRRYSACEMRGAAMRPYNSQADEAGQFAQHFGRWRRY